MGSAMNLSLVKQFVSQNIAFLKNFFTDLHHSYFWRYVLVFFIMYLIAAAAILRADAQYGDDVGRSALGYQNWQNWSRYLSVYLSTIIHGNSYLTDMAPMTQLICLLFVSLASATIVYVFTNSQKFQLINVIAILPVGINPYFLECLSFRYDAPYMGLSILASVFPFLFLEKNHLHFAIFSILGLLIMCMTYQAASGIYLVVLLFWGLKTYLFSENVNYKSLCGILLFASILFIISLGFYKIFLVHETTLYGYTTSISQNDLFTTIFHNAQKYLYSLNHDLTKTWKYCVALIAIVSFFNIIIKTKRNHWKSGIIVFLTFSISLIISYGAYLILQTPMFEPRSLYGWGSWLALLSLIGIQSYPKNFVLKAVIVFLSLWFIGYANLYGNALAEQKRYESFRIQLILNDVNQIPAVQKEKITIIGKPVFSPSIKKWGEKYPLLIREIRPQLGNTYWWLKFYFLYSYNLPNLEIIQNKNLKSFKEKLEKLPIIFDHRYHSIYRDGEYIIINLK